ncbi:MAG: hypothetical protein IIY17_02730 [Aeriscardovia sp.]|nr:hypothetical protein [Aeriscardovia sp.]MBQ1425043.1 hypothetical protein [Aeriscardovia sp.]MBQ5493206.1 hypothetical protein [Aeriscardovia sp.]MBQ5520645.1 hypothetical protein [Aeriscardovia sp.]
MRKREEGRLRRSGRTKLPKWRGILAACGGIALAFLTYFFFLNWSVAKNFEGTSALLKSDILALQLDNPNLASLKESQARVLSQLYQEQETSALQLPSTKSAIAKAIQIANQVSQEIDLRYKSSPGGSSSAPPSSSSASAQNRTQITQERQNEADNQQKLNTLLSSNTQNPSSTADSSTAVPQSQKVTKPW